MNIDIQNKFGESGLHMCSGQNGNLEMARLLTMKGANYALKNSLGDSPIGNLFYSLNFTRSSQTLWKS
jgi:ankyrin repeat protein